MLTESIFARRVVFKNVSTKEDKTNKELIKIKKKTGLVDAHADYFRGPRTSPSLKKSSFSKPLTLAVGIRGGPRPKQGETKQGRSSRATTTSFFMVGYAVPLGQTDGSRSSGRRVRLGKAKGPTAALVSPKVGVQASPFGVTEMAFGVTSTITHG